MANEFIARKGLIVLVNGAKITGSFETTGSSIFNGPVTASSGVTGSFTGSFFGDGSGLTGIASTLSFSGSTAGTDVLNLKTESLIFSGSNGISATVTNNTVTFTAPTGTVTSSAQIDHNATTNYVANQHIDHSTVSITAGSGLSGGGNITATRTLSLDTSSLHFESGVRKEISSSNTTGASGINLTYNQTTGTISGSLVNSSVTVNGQTVSLGGSTTVTANTTNALTLGNGLTGTSFNGSTAVTTTVDTSSAHFTNGVKAKLNADGVVSSSAQIDVRNTTGIATIATTGSNTFTGIQTISNTTQNTNHLDGALIVAGGIGVGKNVTISGSLNVYGLLSAISMSTQYVTSSQYNVGVSRITLNDDDNVRFAGLSIYDSGSASPTTASILWDSLNHKFIYENLSGSGYNSAMFIAGPVNTDALGNEVGLTVGRIPVASGTDHIDSRPVSSSIRVDFPSRLTHIEAGLQVTGSITASAGFSGDGSQLTGIVTNLNITGSDGGSGTVALKTQALTIDGTNGLTATVSGQTITISGSNATTSSIGVASFTGSNFTVTDGIVSGKPITFNSVPLNLGSSYAFGLQNITSTGATTGDRLTLNGGAIIHGVLFTSGSNTDVDTGTEIVASIATASYDAAFFDYVVKNGVNYRAGTVMAVWDGLNNVEFTDTSTNDLGNTTPIVFSVDALSSAVRLKATATSDNWSIKTAVRVL